MGFEQLICGVSFEDSVTPKYQAIAEELANSIVNGQLSPGEKLPPQRQLAHQLGVTTSTVSRAYASLEKRGLATARVGDGTYVAAADHLADATGQTPAIPLIDLAHNVAIPTDEVASLACVFEALAADPAVIAQVLSYQPETGFRRHREAGAQWLRRFGAGSSASRVMVTHGAQHGLACVLRTLGRPGDTVLTESLGYPGLQALARLMRMQVIGVEIDEEGMLPDALERAAKIYGTKLVYCSPSLQNPTTCTMSMSRRKDIAAVARRCGLLVIEDCVHAAAQANSLPALSTWLPEQSFLLSSFSKLLAPGLRVGFLEAAPEWLGKFAACMRADCWLVAPLLPEIATLWLESGAMEELIERQRQHVGERMALAKSVLGDRPFKADPDLPLIWLPLPEAWQAGEFAAALRRAGVTVRTADHFAMGRSRPPNAVRLSLNAASTSAQLQAGLNILTSVLRTPP